MASSIAAMTSPRSIDFSRATASAICSSSSLLALTAAMAQSPSVGSISPRRSLSAFRPMFFGVFRGGLLVRLQFRLPLVALCRIAFPGMRRWRRLQPEILTQLALRGLAAPHRFRDQLVGQNQPCVGDILHDQHDVAIFARGCVIAM